MKDNHTNNVVKQPKEKGLIFYADRGRAKIVFDSMIKRLVEKGQPYNYALVPQVDNLLPKNLVRGGKEHAIFLFMLCLWMRNGIKSDTASDFLRQMHEKEPHLFDPSEYIGNFDELVLKIKEALIDHRLGQRVDENSIGWVHNMQKLHKFWDGDPRKLMNDKPSFTLLVKRIRSRDSKGKPETRVENNPNGFMFFREKMVAMIAYFLMDADLIPIFFTPVPVDFHVLRLLTSNKILRVRGKNEMETLGINFLNGAALKASRDITEWYCRNNMVSPVALCDALWLLSRTLCRQNPGNSGYVKNDKRKLATKNLKNHDHAEFDLEVEMLFDDNSLKEPEVTGRKRYQGLKWSEQDIWNKSRKKRFEKTCGICPVRDYCTYNISAGAYYVGGNLLPERTRLEPPNHQHHFLDHDAFRLTIQAPVKPGVRFSEVSMV